MITKKKSGQLIKFRKVTYTKKGDYFSVKRLLKKVRKTGSMNRRHGSE